MAAPLTERKRVLADLVPNTRSVRLVDYFEGDGELVFQKSVEQGFEGVVVMRKASVYDPTRTWLKAKSSITEEFVIGGYVVGPHTGTLLGVIVGLFEDGHLKYGGNVGAGIGAREKDALITRLVGIGTDTSPFSEELRLVGTPIWVKPELRVEVRFTPRTHGGYMREPVFVRLV